MTDEPDKPDAADSDGKTIRPGDTTTMNVRGQDLRRWQIMHDALPDPDDVEEDDRPPPPPPPVRPFRSH